jgi:uncharacterized protein (DUF1501 family)
VVFLRGAYDSANLLVPISGAASDFYRSARPGIAVPMPGEANGALPLDGDWGLHPALARSLMPLFQKKQAAFIPFAGTDDLTRSHFETQDSIELGQSLDRGATTARLPQPAGRRARRGPLTAVAPIAFTDQLPLVLRGEARPPTWRWATSVARASTRARAR